MTDLIERKLLLTENQWSTIILAVDAHIARLQSLAARCPTQREKANVEEQVTRAKELQQRLIRDIKLW